MSELFDDWVCEGTGHFEKFKTLLNTFDEESAVVRIMLKQMRLLFFCGECKNKDDISYYRFVMPSESETKNDTKSLYYKKDDFLKHYGSMMSELVENKSILFDTKNKSFYFVSKYCMNSLMDKAGLRGEIQIPTMYRNLYVSEKFANSNEEVQLVVRRDGTIAKAFGMFSSQYQYISQKIVLYIANSLKTDDYMLDTWHLSHMITQVDMISKEEIRIGNNYFRTGFQIVTSDTGKISFSIYPTLYVDGKKVVLDISSKVQIPHKKPFQDDGIKMGNQAFDKLMEKVENIVEYGIYLFSQAEDTLRKESKEKLNIENKEEMIAYAATLIDTKEMSKILGKKNFVNSLKETIPEDVHDSSKADAIFHVMRTSYINQNDIISTLRYDHFKNIVNVS